MRGVPMYRFDSQVRVRWALICAVAAIVSAVASAADTAKDFEAYEQAALASLQPEFDRITSAHADDPAVQMFQRRIKTVRRLGKELTASFGSVKSSAFDDLLRDVVPAPPRSAPPGQAQSMIAATAILAEYQPLFAEAVPTPQVTPAELKVLRTYYDTAVTAAASFIAERGRIVAAINEDAEREIIELCAVVPFLHVPDEHWSEQHLKRLPKWMRAADPLAKLEHLALRVDRLNTAYHCAHFDESAAAKPGDKPDYLDYLEAAAVQMADAREYHAAIRCYRESVERAAADDDSKHAAELRFKFARLLGKIGHPPLAADEMTNVMAQAPDDITFAKAAMLRLKYLFEARQFDDIMAEAPALIEDEKSASYRPQIIYITWVTNRRKDKHDRADRLQQQFLKRYPKHPLAADIYFSTAMTALAAADYAEAARLLEIIQYRFPDSSLQKRVKEIQERMQKTRDAKRAH